MKVQYAVFNDTEARDRAMGSFVVGNEPGCFNIEAVGPREIRFNKDSEGEDDLNEFYEGCEEDFLVEEREEN